MRKQMPEKRDCVSSFEWLVLCLDIKSTRGEIPLATDKCSWLNLLRKEEFPLWGRMCGIRMATDKILTRQQRLLSVLRHRLFFISGHFSWSHFCWLLHRVEWRALLVSGKSSQFFSGWQQHWICNTISRIFVKLDLWHGIESRWLLDSRNVQRQAPGVCVVHLFVLAKADMDFCDFPITKSFKPFIPICGKPLAYGTSGNIKRSCDGSLLHSAFKSSTARNRLYSRTFLLCCLVVPCHAV